MPSPETMRKLCLSAKFPYQEIRWNYGILRSVYYKSGSAFWYDADVTKLEIYYKVTRNNPFYSAYIRKFFQNYFLLFVLIVCFFVCLFVYLLLVCLFVYLFKFLFPFFCCCCFLLCVNAIIVLLYYIAVVVLFCFIAAVGVFFLLLLNISYFRSYVFLTFCLWPVQIPYYTNVNPLSAKPAKWSNTIKQIVGNLSTNCLSVFDHFVGLTLKGLRGILINANLG